MWLSVEVRREAEWGGLEGDTAMVDLEKWASTWCVVNCELCTYRLQNLGGGSKI